MLLAGVITASYLSSNTVALLPLPRAKKAHECFMLSEPQGNKVIQSVPTFVDQTNKAFVLLAKDSLVKFYGPRTFARFYALETIARVPYFSYTSVLHLYETIGFFRQKEFIRLHFSESWNEMHHLLIMEELGGNKYFGDRFIAQHLAFFYYWIVVFLYAFYPAVAYNLNQHIEEHAFETYSEYIEKNQDSLKSQAAPEVAIKYYSSDPLFLNRGNSSHLSNCSSHSESFLSIQRPLVIQNLLDVFLHIRADEAEHSDMMKALQSHPAIQR
jgi:ubiquinol oxidase